MSQGGSGKWIKRILGLVAVLVVASGAYVAANWTSLNARYAARQLRTATTVEEQTAAAAKLVALGDVGSPYLVELFHGEDADRCAIVVGVLDDKPPAEPIFGLHWRTWTANVEPITATGAESLLPLIPRVLDSTEMSNRTACQAIVRKALQSPTPAARVQAIRLAMNPGIGIQSETVTMLNDASAEVRRAAMLAVGPVMTGQSKWMEDEALFKWLHDSDADVQQLCAAALSTRGLDESQIALARKLSSPSAADRLSLLMDLRYSEDGIPDPRPWLDRLSRDADPAVRAGVVRVAFECQLNFATSTTRLAENDPDPTVRRLAQYYRSLGLDIRPTGFQPE